MAKEDLPGSLGIIAKSVSKAAEIVGEEHKKWFNWFALNLLDIRKELLDNQLGWLYRDWHNAPSGSPENKEAWHRFVDCYYGVQADSPEHQVTFKNYPEVVSLGLPRIPAYQGNDVYDLAKVEENAVMQANFARTLGILREGETWRDFMKRPGIVGVRNNHKEAVEWLRLDPKILPCIEHSERMIEFPFIESEIHPGVIVGLKFYPPEKDIHTCTEQFIRQGRAFVVTTLFFSTDLFFDDAPNHLQTPEGKGRFLSDLSQRFLIPSLE